MPGPLRKTKPKNESDKAQKCMGAQAIKDTETDKRGG